MINLLVGVCFLLVAVGYLDFPGRNGEQARAIQEKWKWTLVIGGICLIATGVRFVLA